MKKSTWNLMLGVVLMGSLLMAGSPLAAEGVGNKPGFASVNLGGNGAEWLPNGNFGRMTLTVSAPGGAVYRQEFAAGATPSFSLFDKRGQRLPDGAYNWELVAAPIVSPDTRAAMREARRTNNEEAIASLQKAGRLPSTPLVQSGSFVISGGSFVEPQGVEPRGTEAKKSPIEGLPLKDQVIPDDLIVQGSACIGLDCVNNESFGFDTIRLKENSTRIKFEDTSVGNFPTNDWQLTANDSASGGSNKFSIEDITGSRVPFTVTAGAATNSIFVDSTGRVGFRTSTPVLDLHVNTSNTPAIRLEQNNSGGFTAQTWDVAGNEANFFVRDVTGGSRLPFRIRPGAPTSSIDISSDGDVGVGTASPDNKLFVSCNVAGGPACIGVQNLSATGFSSIEFQDESGNVTANFGRDNSADTFRLNSISSNPIVILTNSTERIRFPAPGGNFITASNGAILTAGGVWQSVSSREAKRDITDLSNGDALSTLKGLTPVTFRYKAEPDEQYVGFVAEDVPNLVAANDHKTLNSMDIVAVLTKVVQEQQKTIEALAAKVDQLEKANQK